VADREEPHAIMFDQPNNLGVITALVNAHTPAEIRSNVNVGNISQRVADAVERLRAGGTVRLPAGQDRAGPQARFINDLASDDAELESQARGGPVVFINVQGSDDIEAGADLRVGGAGVNIQMTDLGMEAPAILGSIAPIPGGGGFPFSPIAPAVAVGLSALLARMAGPVRASVQAFFRIGFVRGATVRWNSLPSWVRTAFVAAGATVGTDILLDGDIPFIDIPSFGRNGHEGPHLEHLGAHVIGTWQANGVTFYRLSDGKMAVQNKAGRWKVWRPKKPIVLMPGGASNLRTLLRADKLLNKQAKALAKMLNRRAPRRSSGAKGGGSGPNIAMRSGTIIDV